MPRVDTDFAERIDKAIKSTPHVAKRDLRYVVDEGQVVLRGVVNTYFQKQMAQEAVQRVDGVQGISNELEVSWS